MAYGFYQREFKKDRLFSPSENGVTESRFVSAIKSTDDEA